MPPRRKPQNKTRRRVAMGEGWETSLVRKAGAYPQRYVALVATNGKETEKQYIVGLKSEAWIRDASKIVDRVFLGSPVDVVRQARRLQQTDDYDSVWVICDVDQYDPADVGPEMRGSAVEVLWSNPCFEVWLLLHLVDCNRHFDRPEQVEDRLSRVLRSPWNKTRVDYARFRVGIRDAVERAKRMVEAPGGNPSTSVWRLVEALFAAHDEAHAAVQCNCLEQTLL